MYCWLFITDTGYEIVSNIEPLWDSQDRCYRCLDIDSTEDICLESSTVLPKGSIKRITGKDIGPSDKPVKIKI